MAVEQRVICDRCRSVLIENRAALVVQSGPLRIRRETLDLCSDCQDQLEGWLAEFSPEMTEAALSSPETLTIT